MGTSRRDLERRQGPAGLKGSGNSCGNRTQTITVRPGAERDCWTSAFGANSGYARSISVQSNATLKVLTSPNTLLTANVSLDEGAACVFLYGSGGQTMNGTCRLNGLIHLLVGDRTVTFTNVIS